MTARPAEDGQVQDLLTAQVYSPVLWEDSVTWLIEQGVDTFIEIGSGSVLTGLIKKTDKTVKLYNVNSLETLEATTSALK